MSRTRRAALLCLAAVAAAACDDTAGPARFDARLYAGTYAGTWTNLTTGAGGAATIIIDLQESTRTASLTLDFDGNYLGLGDPPAATLTGTYDDSGAHVKGTSPLFGEYDVTIDAEGGILGVMKNLAGGAIPELTYTGTLTATTMDADYVVRSAAGQTTNAILRLRKNN
jgi:hypothetical protein